MGGAVLFFAFLSLLGTAFGSWIQTEAPGTVEIGDISVGNVYEAFEVNEPTPFTLWQDGFLDPATGIISSNGSLTYAVNLNAEAVAAVVSDSNPAVISGRLVAASALFVDGEERALRTVTYLHFDDGTKLGIVEEHRLFDREANRYVYIHPDDASSYIGHEFYREDGNHARLLAVENVVENVRAYDLPTTGHLNFFSEALSGCRAGSKASSTSSSSGRT